MILLLCYRHFSPDYSVIVIYLKFAVSFGISNMTPINTSVMNTLRKLQIRQAPSANDFQVAPQRPRVSRRTPQDVASLRRSEFRNAAN